MMRSVGCMRWVCERYICKRGRGKMKGVKVIKPFSPGAVTQKAP